MIATLQACMRRAVTSLCVKSPRHLSHTMSAFGITLTTRVASCSTTHLSRKQELRNFRSFVNLVSGRVDRPRDEVVFGTRWVDINKGDEHKPFYRSRLVAQEYKRQADWSFFAATPPLEALRSLLICTTIGELPNELGQPVARAEPVVLMLIDMCRAHFYSPARRKVFVELPEEAGTDKSNVGRLLRSMHGCRDAGVNGEFATCQVMIAIGILQVEHHRASTVIWRSSSVCGYTETTLFLSVTSSMSDGSL